MICIRRSEHCGNNRLCGDSAQRENMELQTKTLDWPEGKQILIIGDVMLDAALLSNLAGGIAVEEVGCFAATREKLARAIDLEEEKGLLIQVNKLGRLLFISAMWQCIVFSEARF